MAGYGDFGRETPLVSALVRAGIRHGRAAAFERALDDHPFCGISGTMLGRLIEILISESASTPMPPESSSATSVPALASRQVKFWWQEQGEQTDAIRR